MRTLTCPRCRRPWEVEAVRAGMKAVCPHCQASITIAAPPAKKPPLDVQEVAAGTATATVPASQGIVAPVAEPAAAPMVAPSAAVPPPEVVKAEVPSEVSRQEASVPVDVGRRSRRPAMWGGAAAVVVTGIAVALWHPWSEVRRQDDDSAKPAFDVGAAPNPSSPRVAANAVPPSATASPPSDAVAVAAASDVPPDASTEEIEVPPAAAVATPAEQPPPVVTESVPSTTIAVAPPAVPDRAASEILRRPAPPPVYDRAPLPEGAEGTRPVTAQMRFRAGDKLHAEHNGRWYSVTFVEARSDGNVRVRWDTWGREFESVISRGKLRMPGK